MVAGDCGYDVFSRLNGAAGWGRMLCFSYRNPNLELRHFSSSIRNASSLCLKDNKKLEGIFFQMESYEGACLLEIVGEWVMNRQPFWIKIFHISPILFGRFSDKKEWNLLSVLCSLWGIFRKENLQCVFSLQTLQCAIFWFSLKLA